MRERTGILANTRKTSQEMVTGLESSQSPINATTRNLVQYGQVPRLIRTWPIISVSSGYLAETREKSDDLFLAFPDKFGVGGPLIDRTRLW